jgi:hypothetical protein
MVEVLLFSIQNPQGGAARFLSPGPSRGWSGLAPASIDGARCRPAGYVASHLSTDVASLRNISGLKSDTRCPGFLNGCSYGLWSQEGADTRLLPANAVAVGNV